MGERTIAKRGRGRPKGVIYRRHCGVYLDEETWRRLREQAARSSRSQSSLIRDLIKAHVDSPAERSAGGA